MMQSGVHATITGVLLAFAIPFSPADNKGGAGPSYRLQHALHKPVAFIILPLFAMANTGIPLASNWIQQLKSNNSIGIVSGLFIGKTFGILLFSWLLIKMKWGQLPEAVYWRHLFGTAILAGIGFTMSIFIANLAFTDTTLIQDSKIAVLAGSLISCIIGLFVLRLSTNHDISQK
jgi:NhaA family Na+:H+ antiporter